MTPMLGGKNKRGFTIVELLIVIVVIGILAAITVVAFGAVQQKATNNSIAQAANAWTKALKMYKVDNGQWINSWTCLGEGYLYGVSGTDPTGTAQCRETNGTGYTENTAFKNAMRPYFNGGKLPTPPFYTAASSDGTQWRRGIHYAYGGGSGTDVYLNVAYRGDVGTCPGIQGISGSKTIWSGNSMCHYNIGSTVE